MKKIYKYFGILVLMLSALVLSACKENIYNITFEENGGSEIQDIQTAENTTISLTDKVPTKSGYEFAGWFVDSEFITEFDETTSIISDLTLYAKWDKLYKVTLSLEGGKISGKDEYEFQSTSNVTIPYNPTKSGYWFSGWYYDLEYVNKVDADNLVISGNTTLYAKWEEAYLSTQVTESLKIEDFKNKSFFDDGFGEVKLVNCTDGDTIQVRDLNASENHLLTIRFLGVDTPESTGQIEPWGFAASNYTKSKLLNAHSIVLEYEDLEGTGSRVDSNGTRYLAFVWYQLNEGDEYRNLCLELVEQAYSKISLSTRSKYHSYFLAANSSAQATGERVWGSNNDPDYNYDKDIISTTVYNMLEHGEENVAGTQYNITVRVALQCGSSFYVEDVNADENGNVGYIYVYGGYSGDYYRDLAIGDVINFNCKLQYEGNFGTQLTDIKKMKWVSKAANNELYEYREISPADLERNLGASVIIKDCEYVSYYQSETDKENADKLNAFVGTLKFRKDGIEFNYRVSKDLIGRYSLDSYRIGQKYDLIGGVTEYYGEYQLAAADSTKLVLENEKPIFDNYFSTLDLNNVTADFILLSTSSVSGMKISYKSNNGAIEIVENQDGSYTAKVNQTTVDTQVIITLTLKYKSLPVTRNYVVTVKAK